MQFEGYMERQTSVGPAMREERCKTKASNTKPKGEMTEGHGALRFGFDEKGDKLLETKQPGFSLYDI